ncbi:hypothetical protein LEMLEM_LOCUS25451, partial [Lemmus lemmus]
MTFAGKRIQTGNSGERKWTKGRKIWKLQGDRVPQDSGEHFSSSSRVIKSTGGLTPRSKAWDKQKFLFSCRLAQYTLTTWSLNPLPDSSTHLVTD